MGGEVAAKEVGELVVEGVALVRELMEEAYIAASSRHEEEERIARCIRKRANEGSKTQKNKPEKRIWCSSDKEALVKGLRRYPGGHPGRWTAIAGYLNYQLQPDYDFEPMESMIAAYLYNNPTSHAIVVGLKQFSK